MRQQQSGRSLSPRSRLGGIVPDSTMGLRPCLCAAAATAANIALRALGDQNYIRIQEVVVFPCLLQPYWYSHSERSGSGWASNG